MKIYHRIVKNVISPVLPVLAQAQITVLLAIHMKLIKGFLILLPKVAIVTFTIFMIPLNHQNLYAVHVIKHV
jgi:hypothetical protein